MGKVADLSIFDVADAGDKNVPVSSIPSPKNHPI